MKPEEILDALNDIRESFLASADERRQNPKGRQKPIWIRWTAAAACIALIAGVVLRVMTMSGNSFVIAAAEYPEAVPFPKEQDYEASGDWDAYSDAMEAWADNRRWKWEADLTPLSSMNEYFIRSTRQFVGGDSSENRVFSPMNVYMALAMLAETTDGDSRTQILDLLGVGDVDSLRDTANLAWRLTYTDDGSVTQVLANSLWLNENVEFRRQTVDTLAGRYYASTFRGEMGSDAFNKALQDWLNEQTGGLLGEEASQIVTSPATILALASTVYFKGAWQDEFLESFTSQDTFHGAKGDVPADFMHRSDTMSYYRGENFGAVSLNFRNAGEMWLILPDEGSSPDEVIGEDEMYDMLLHPGEYEDCWTCLVNLSIPKFDVNATTDLIDGLMELGVTDVFNASVSDFTPLTENDGLAVTEATHSARVTIDEEGCTAAAFTVMMIEETAMMEPSEEVDFTLDRPFLFAVMTREGLPLFTGAVETLE